MVLIAGLNRWMQGTKKVQRRFIPSNAVIPPWCEDSRLEALPRPVGGF